MKVEVTIRFDIDEEETDYKGQKLLDNVRENIEEVIVQESVNGGKVIEVKFVEEDKGE